MDCNNALDAILALRAIWEQKRGRVTLADLEILVRRCVRSRGAAALPPERWRGRPWRATTRHEVVFEARPFETYGAKTDRPGLDARGDLYFARVPVSGSLAPDRLPQGFRRPVS
jgi:hypothetical protein